MVLRSETPPFSAPAAAYRADMATRDHSFGEDEDLIAAATHLHAAAKAKGAPAREYLFEALGVAIDSLGDERIDAFVQCEWDGQRSYVEALAALIQSMQDRGALHLAALMLDDLLMAARDITPLERGRLLAMRARADWKLGRLTEAEERYEYIASLGAEDTTGELATRAELGLLALSQLRGNMPDVRAHAERAAALGKQHDLRYLACQAYLGLAMAESKAGRFADAVRAAWESFALSAGHPAREAEALQVIGQTMLEAGHPSLARASFAAVTTRATAPRVVLAALGGLALASARESREATVEWAVREVRRAVRVVGRTYELAEALVECAIALRILGRVQESERCRVDALEIATAQRFNELVFLAERVSAATPASRKAAPIGERPLTQAIAALEPERLPGQIEFEVAPV